VIISSLHTKIFTYYCLQHVYLFFSLPLHLTLIQTLIYTQTSNCVLFWTFLCWRVFECVCIAKRCITKCKYPNWSYIIVWLICFLSELIPFHNNRKLCKASTDDSELLQKVLINFGDIQFFTKELILATRIHIFQAIKNNFTSVLSNLVKCN
jgi:magnesium-transporting ATPase (P-type)